MKLFKSKRGEKYLKTGLLLLGLCVLICLIIIAVSRMQKPKYEYWWEAPLVAHGGGGINGWEKTNSLEAMNLAAQNGYQVIEVDFSLTSDGELVLTHGWNEDSAAHLEVPEGIVDLQSFQNRKVCRKYTPMTGNDLVTWMRRHTSIYIITDIKYDSDEELDMQFRKLVELCGNDADVLDRFVVYVYDTEMYDAIKKIYDFPNIIYATYRTAEKDIAYWNKVREECVERDIKVVLMPRSYVSTDRHPVLPYVDILKDAGLLVCVYNINTITDMEKMRNAGADIVMSDYLTEDDLQYLE